MLLASDLDGTLIATEEAHLSSDGIERLSELFTRRSNRLAYVTGRGFDLALKGIADKGLPTAEFLICDVGTSLYHYTENGYEISPGYRSRLRSIWQEGVIQNIDRILGEIPDCHQQGEDCQTDFKRSFFLTVDENIENRLSTIETALNKEKLPASVVFSIDPVTNKGLLDILPIHVNKEFALGFLHKESGVPRAQIVYAGDSGNDLAVFTSTWHAIMVANTPERIKLQARRERIQSEYQLFEASRPCVEGVLEGCRHFGFE